MELLREVILKREVRAIDEIEGMATAFRVQRIQPRTVITISEIAEAI